MASSIFSSFYPSEIKKEIKTNDLSEERNVLTFPTFPKVPIPRNLVQVRRRGNPSIRRDKVTLPGPKKGKKSRGRQGLGSVSIADAMSYAKRGYDLAKYLASLINVEEKFFDVNANGTAISSTGTIVNLTNIAEGADYNQRQGNSILLQSISFDVLCFLGAAATASVLRLVILSDNDQRGTDPAFADVFEVTGSNVVLVSPLLHYTSKRFTVLYDETVPLNSGFSSQACIERRIFQRKLHRHVKYQGTTGADGSNWEGSLYLLMISNEATNTPSVVYNCRVQFTDN